MALEAALIKRTRLGNHKNCLALIEAYAALAPRWQRILLATYVSIGPPVARWFGGNTETLWQQADLLIADLLATSGMSAQEVVEALLDYVKIKREEENHLSFEQARESIYDRSFYPLVTHFTLAFQPSAVARMRFVQRAFAAMPLAQGTVADIGCGSGAILCETLRLRPTWTGTGLDISEAAIAYAIRLAARKGVADRVRFQAGSLMEIPYKSNSLDLVIASEVIEHLPEPERALRELSRVLAPAGRLLITMPVASHSPAHMQALNNAGELNELCEAAGLRVASIKCRWHFGFGDDRRHIFAMAQTRPPGENQTKAPYSLALPQRSSAASSGMVSS